MTTDHAMVGSKVVLDWAGREIVATIKRLDSTYPTTAYTVTWTKADNPNEDIPTDCAGIYSIAHCGQVKRVAA
jgi:hypothetical protein